MSKAGSGEAALHVKLRATGGNRVKTTHPSGDRARDALARAGMRIGRIEDVTPVSGGTTQPGAKRPHTNTSTGAASDAPEQPFPKKSRFVSTLEPYAYHQIHGRFSDDESKLGWHSLGELCCKVHHGKDSTGWSLQAPKFTANGPLTQSATTPEQKAAIIKAVVDVMNKNSVLVHRPNGDKEAVPFNDAMLSSDLHICVDITNTSAPLLSFWEGPIEFTNVVRYNSLVACTDRLIILPDHRTADNLCSAICKLKENKRTPSKYYSGQDSGCLSTTLSMLLTMSARHFCRAFCSEEEEHDKAVESIFYTLVDALYGERFVNQPGEFEVLFNLVHRADTKIVRPSITSLMPDQVKRPLQIVDMVELDMLTAYTKNSTSETEIAVKALMILTVILRLPLEIRLSGISEFPDVLRVDWSVHDDATLEQYGPVAAGPQKQSVILNLVKSPEFLKTKAAIDNGLSEIHTMQAMIEQTHPEGSWKSSPLKPDEIHKVLACSKLLATEQKTRSEAGKQTAGKWKRFLLKQEAKMQDGELSPGELLDAERRRCIIGVAKVMTGVTKPKPANMYALVCGEAPIRRIFDMAFGHNSEGDMSKAANIVIGNLTSVKSAKMFSWRKQEEATAPQEDPDKHKDDSGDTRALRINPAEVYLVCLEFARHCIKSDVKACMPSDPKFADEMKRRKEVFVEAIMLGLVTPAVSGQPASKLQELKETRQSMQQTFALSYAFLAAMMQTRGKALEAMFWASEPTTEDTSTMVRVPCNIISRTSQFYARLLTSNEPFRESILKPTEKDCAVSLLSIIQALWV